MEFNKDAQVRMMKGLEESGVPREQAVAVICALEFALVQAEYAVQYGTYLRGHLEKFVETTAAAV